MSLEHNNNNSCFGMYRSSDSYIQGTADYERWLNCELNTEFVSAENSGNVWNGGTTVNNTNKDLDVTINNLGGGGIVQATNNAPIITVTQTDSMTTKASVNSNDVLLIDKAKQNPLATFGIIFAVAYLVFKK